MQAVDKSLLKRFQPLDSLPDKHLKELCAHARLESLPTGKMLFKRNQSLEAYHYLVSGAVDLLNVKYQATRINANSTEALQPLVESNISPVTIMAASTSQILILNRAALDQALTWDQAGNYLVKELGQQVETNDTDWMSSLLSARLFQHIPPANLQRLFGCFKEIPARIGQMIIEQGSHGDSFFVIKRGAAEVTRTGADGVTQTLAHLSTGQYFGEEALIGNTQRNANIIMTQPGVLMQLTKSDFTELLAKPLAQYISDKDLDALRQQHPVTLVDVRSHNELTSAPPGRLLIPLTELRARLDELNPEHYYVVCPESGDRAVIGSYLMKQAGLQAMNLQA